MARKAERTLSLWWDVLVLTKDGQRSVFKLVEVDGEGPRCWQLFRRRRPSGPDCYLVWKGPSGYRCDCPAGRRHRPCKHASAVKTLVETGRL